MSRLAYLETDPGRCIVWAAPPPPDRSRTPVAWRRRALWAARAAKGGEDFLREAPSWREATVLEGKSLEGERLADLLATIRERMPGLLLRVELDWSGGEPLPFTGKEVPRLAEIEAVFLHGVIHHPDALTAPLGESLAVLADAGLPLAAEVWLLRGHNDQAALLRRLLLGLIGRRVRPYHLVDGAWLPRSLRVAPAAAEALVRQIRGWISGLAVPQLVLERRDGRRRPRVPGYIEEIGEAGVRVVNYKGRSYWYPNPEAPPEKGNPGDHSSRPSVGPPTSPKPSSSSPSS